ncbi:hypothetical protein LC040_03125 [Bacillus tianshenii]|nr:hypothetical protein LC040_03125 [Bacillus tianshenii]
MVRKWIQIVFWTFVLGLFACTVILFYTDYYKVAAVTGGIFLFIMYNVAEYHSHKNETYLHMKNRGKK